MLKLMTENDRDSDSPPIPSVIAADLPTLIDTMAGSGLPDEGVQGPPKEVEETKVESSDKL